MHFNLEAYAPSDANESDPDPIFTTTAPTFDAVNDVLAEHFDGCEYKYLFRKGNVATYDVRNADGEAVAVLIVEPIL